MTTPAAPALDFALVGERHWLDFVNTDDAVRGARVDVLGEFATFTRWLEATGQLDAGRAHLLRQRAGMQRAGATAILVDARRIRAALRRLAERGAATPAARDEALGEINRVLGRSAGMRRVEHRDDGSYARVFVATGDVLAGLAIPVVESAADSLIAGELSRVRRCANPRCTRVFLDTTRNGARRWCDMTTCGNRAKAERFRKRNG